MIEPFTEEVQTRLRKSVRDIESQLGHGHCGAWEHYHRQVGFIAGLESASAIVSQVRQAFNEEEDRDEQ